MMSVRSALFLSAALLASGCEVTSELGKPCTLVRKATPEERPAGVRSTPVLESEIAPNQDFISFGSMDCEDLICVRDADVPSATRDPERAGPGLLQQGVRGGLRRV